MRMARIEFLFDLVSPASYLAWGQLASLGAEIAPVPVLLGAIMQATGNRPPGSVPAKGRWLREDLGAFARRYGVAFTIPDPFPFNSLVPQRMATALLGTERFAPFCDAVFAASFARGEDVGNRAVLDAALVAAGFEPEALHAAAATPQVKDRLRIATDGAVARGVFGAPTFFVGDRMFWGQDRLQFVAEALRA